MLSLESSSHPVLFFLVSITRFIQKLHSISSSCSANVARSLPFRGSNLNFLTCLFPMLAGVMVKGDARCRRDIRKYVFSLAGLTSLDWTATRKSYSSIQHFWTIYNTTVTVLRICQADITQYQQKNPEYKCWKRHSDWRPLFLAPKYYIICDRLGFGKWVWQKSPKPTDCLSCDTVTMIHISSEAYHRTRFGNQLKKALRNWGLPPKSNHSERT